MNRTCFLLAVGLMCQAVLAQTQPGAMAFQQADSLDAGRAGRGVAPNTLPIPRQETGKPFSATATTQSSQTLSDGTHVSQTITMRQYRDMDGRVRMEPREPGDSSFGPPKSIVIYDPVAGVTYRLDPAKKTVTQQVTSPAAGPSITGSGGRRGGRGDSAPDSNSDAAAKVRQALDNLNELRMSVQAARNEAGNDGGRVSVEDLGTLIVNGVPARGTRVTTLVLVGAIGNDKEFRSVAERWFSPDLNLLIKSVSADPRFGTTTYELTNIGRQPPDPSLFQPPAGYSIISTQTPAAKAIEEIEFRGIKHVSQDTLNALVLSKVGGIFNEETLRGDFAALWKTGRFSDVQVKTEPGARGGLIIRFVVTERP